MSLKSLFGTKSDPPTRYVRSGIARDKVLKGRIFKPKNKKKKK